jgi:hypothetical protein
MKVVFRALLVYFLLTQGLSRFCCTSNNGGSYWNYNRPEDAGIAGSPTIPSLNIIGYSDEYFGYQDSVSTSVASVGEYPPITGNAFDAFVAAGLEWGLVAHLEGGRHGLTWTHDTVIREVRTPLCCKYTRNRTCYLPKE